MIQESRFAGLFYPNTRHELESSITTFFNLSLAHEGSIFESRLIPSDLTNLLNNSYFCPIPFGKQIHGAVYFLQNSTILALGSKQ